MRTLPFVRLSASPLYVRARTISILQANPLLVGATRQIAILNLICAPV